MCSTGAFLAQACPSVGSQVYGTRIHAATATRRSRLPAACYDSCCMIHQLRAAPEASTRGRHGTGRRLQLPVVCFHDKRRAAWNSRSRQAKLREQGAPQQAPIPTNASGVAGKRQRQAAEATVVWGIANELRAFTSNQVSLELALFLYTQQPSLLRIPPGTLAARLMQLSNGLDLSPADMADLLVRNPQLVNLLPARLRRAGESLAAALSAPLPAALVLLAGDLTLMDVPPLQLQQQVAGLAAVLQLPTSTAVRLVVQQPSLAWLTQEVLQTRMTALCGLLDVDAPIAAALVLEEPRLLLVRASALANNLTAAKQSLGLRRPRLISWVRRAPALLLLEASELSKRLAGLPDALSNAAAPFIAPAAAHLRRDHQIVLQYVERDPRVLLLSAAEVRERATWWFSLHVPKRPVLWALACHPSYLVTPPGAAEQWLRSVEHLLQCSMRFYHILLLTPEVFLCTPVEHMLLVVNQLCAQLQQPLEEVQQLVSRHPHLLCQPLEALSAGWQQVCGVMQYVSGGAAAAAPGDIQQQEQHQQRPEWHARAVELVKAHPELLLVPEGALQPLLQQQADLLGLSFQEYAAGVAASGCVLQLQVLQARGLDESQLLGRAQLLLSCGLRSPVDMLRLMLEQQQVLLLDQQMLAFTLEQLVASVSLHESWSSELAYSLPRPVLAKCLCNARRNLPKLWYLAEKGLAYKSPMEEVITMDTFSFYNLYGPTWVKWLERNKRRFQSWSGGDVAYAGWRQEVCQAPSSEVQAGQQPELGGGRSGSWGREGDSTSTEADVGGLGSARREDLQLLQRLLGKDDVGEEVGGEGEEEGGSQEEGADQDTPWTPDSLAEAPAAGGRVVGGATQAGAAAVAAVASGDGAGEGFQVPLTWLSGTGQAQGAALAAGRLYGSQEGSLLVWPQDFQAEQGRGRSTPR